HFDTEKGGNALVDFDINDFDEAAHALCAWDLGGFMTSALVAASTLKIKAGAASALCESYLDAYAAALAKGQSRVVERETATGLVKRLLVALEQRRRQDFLDERTEVRGKQRSFLIDRKGTRPVTEQERNAVGRMLKAWAAKQANPRFFKLLDVAHRIAGTGSLGIERYVLLVEGNGSPHRNYLLDFKEEPGSCLRPYLPTSQPAWANEAARVVAVQERFQGTPPALLSAAPFERKAFLLRELQPLQDRVRLTPGQGQIKQLTKLMRTMGEITACDQLRSGGRQGSA